MIRLHKRLQVSTKFLSAKRSISFGENEMSTRARVFSMETWRAALREMGYPSGFSTTRFMCRVGQLTAYFSGLVSEGWLRRVQAFEQRIHPADEFTLLINNGRDLAGAETILPV